MRDLVVWLAQQLVEDKAAVLELTVAEDDLGRVIGRGGRTAKALRTVLDIAARRQSRRAVLDILD